jgi:phosphoserine phosphatase
MEENPLALARLAAANHWLRDEIERLRLTDAEREAIAEAVGAYNFNDDDEECARIAATLHGLLKRTERRS